MGVHQQLIEDVVNRLVSSGKYDFVKKNVEYKLGCRIVGEVDVYAFRKVGENFYLLLFEMKSNNTPKSYHKALEQLARHKLNKHELVLGDNADRVFKFYVYKSSGVRGYEVTWVR